MSTFLLIIFTLFASNFIWWAWADAWLRKTHRAVGWRLAVGLYALSQAGLFVFMIYARMVDLGSAMPQPLLIAVYVWHLVILPVVMLALIGRGLFKGVAGVVRAIAGKKTTAEPETLSSDPVLANGPTRRQILAATLVAAAPPVAELAAVTTAVTTLGSFRINKMDIAFRNLPSQLDGVTIAHLSDTHIGRFTHRGDIRQIAEATNRLDADVVAFTGDLIDFDLDELPNGLELLKGLQPRHGVVVCEGNHDLFQDRSTFEQGVMNAGFPLLLNESHTIDINGYPMQFLGLQWGEAALRRDPMLQQWAAVALEKRRPDAFGVMLAHHPHAFDYAAKAGVQLTLAGHTHGGQLMLSKNVGPGPVMYRYWSGLYRQGNAACVVSNGIGNWFPLRINAPAEIVHIRLSKA
ncbi:MAG TPA: metallophosphoesterase [Tepidisphaeraceae bacterium]|jgi:hypothetical protein|nr:metallophosphoesterase [Tepidisphaeraceae bacterium]